MKIDDQLIDDLSRLSKLSFEGKEREAIKSDLKNILNFMEVLSELDTDQVEPLIFMSDAVNTWRNDEAKTSISKEEALKNVPFKDSDYIKVHKFVD